MEDAVEEEVWIEAVAVDEVLGDWREVDRACKSAFLPVLPGVRMSRRRAKDDMAVAARGVLYCSRGIEGIEVRGRLKQ